MGEYLSWIFSKEDATFSSESSKHQFPSFNLLDISISIIFIFCIILVSRSVLKTFWRILKSLADSSKFLIGISALVAFIMWGRCNLGWAYNNTCTLWDGTGNTCELMAEFYDSSWLLKILPYCLKRRPRRSK